MTCPFDRATLAEYANDDLPAALREATATHLQTCQACRRVVEQYQEGAEALAGAVAAVSLPAGMSQPLPGRRPAWPVWVTTAAVTACIVFALQLPVVAEKVRTVYVSFFTQEQLGQDMEKLAEEVRSGKLDKIPTGTAFTVEEAEQKYRRPLALPAYLPEGYRLRRVMVYGDSPVEFVVQEYWVPGINSSLRIWQRPAREPLRVSYMEGEQPIVVDVNGTVAYVTETSARLNEDGTYTREDDRIRTLTMEWQGDVVRMYSVKHEAAERLSTEELVKIAESIGK